MKPNKLYFKGAWMNFHSGPAKVTGFTDEGVHFTDRFGYGISSGADPIPFTSEIWEKNGFKKTSDGWECDESDVLTIAIHNGKSCDIWLAEAPFDHKHLTYTLPFPRSVHELQAAMRLCGIEKEIIL